MAHQAQEPVLIIAGGTVYSRRGGTSNNQVFRWTRPHADPKLRRMKTFLSKHLMPVLETCCKAVLVQDDESDSGAEAANKGGGKTDERRQDLVDALAAELFKADGTTCAAAAATGTSELEKLAPMRYTRAAAVGLAHRGSFLAVGGFHKQKGTRYRGGGQKWTYGKNAVVLPSGKNGESNQSLNEKRYGAVGGVLMTGMGQALIVAGGTNFNARGGDLSSAELYTVKEGWRMLPPMPFAVLNAAGGVVAGKFYVAGGECEQVFGSEIRTMTDTLVVWDGEAWSLAAALPAPRTGAAGVGVDGKLMVIGGMDANENVLASVIVYDPATDAWSPGPPLPQGLFFASAVVHDGVVTVVGGGDGADGGFDDDGGFSDTLELRGGEWVKRKVLGKNIECGLTHAAVASVRPHNQAELAAAEAAAKKKAAEAAAAKTAALDRLLLLGADSEEERVVVVAFLSLWCEACRTLAPTYAAWSNDPRFADVAFAKVDVDAQQEVAKRHCIRAIPTVKLFHRGVEVDCVVGADPAAVERKIAEYAALPAMPPAAAGAGARRHGQTHVLLIAGGSIYDSDPPHTCKHVWRWNEAADTLERLDPLSPAKAKGRRTSQGMPRMITTRGECCGCTYRGAMLVVGGCHEDTPGGPTGDLLLHDQVAVVLPSGSNRFTNECLAHARFSAAAGVLRDGSLVVAGGRTHHKFLNSVEAYSDTEGWRPLPPMPHAVHQAASGVLEGKFYVAGGVCKKERKVGRRREFDAASKALQIWDGVAWTLGAPLPEARSSAAGVAVDGKFMVIGGVGYDDDSLKTVVVYNPDIDTWSKGPPLPQALFAATAVVHNGVVTVVGGGDGGDGGMANSRGMSDTLQLKDGRWVKRKVLAHAALLRHGLVYAAVASVPASSVFPLPSKA